MANASLIADVKARTGDFERGMDRARGKNESFLASILKTDQGLSKMSQVAGKGLTAVSAGLATVEAAAKGADVNVAQLGTQLLGAFAMGGPVALGVTALGAGLGALIGKISASEEAAKRAREEHVKWLTEAKKRTDEVVKSTEALNDRLFRARAGAAGDRILELNEQIVATEKAQAEFLRIQREAYSLVRTPGATGAGAMLERLEVAEAEAKAQEEKLAALIAAQRAEADAAAKSKERAESEERTSKALQVQYDWLGRIIAKGASMASAGSRGFDALFGGSGKGSGGGSAPDFAAAMAQGHAGPGMPSSEDWAEKMRQMAEASKETAAIAKAEADERERSARAIQAQTSAIRQQADITKRFATLPGTGGIFGFGAGQVGFGWSGGSGDMDYMRRRRKGKTGQGAPTAEAGGAALPDLSPSVNAATAAIKGIPAQWARLGQALDGMQKAAQSAVQAVGDATVRAVGKLSSDVAALRVRVKSVEDRLAAAVALGSGA